jgi:hypothetical protein
MVGGRLLCSMGRRGKFGVASNDRTRRRLCSPPSRGGGLGKGVYVTRSEQKAAWYSDRPGNDGVVIKLKVALGTYAEINEQGTLFRGHGHGAWAVWLCIFTAGAIGVREKNCIADPSRIEIVGLARGYKAPCR